MNYKVKYPALYNIIGCALLEQELPFTRELTRLILEEFVGRIKKDSANVLGDEIDDLLDTENFDFTLCEKSEAIPDGVDVKSSYLDVRFSIATGKGTGQLDYELQRKVSKDLYSRESFYLMKTGSRAFKIGEDYAKPHFTIGIWLLGESNHATDYLRTFSLRDTNNNLMPYCHIIEIDLTKLSSCDNIKLRNYLEIFTKYDLNDYATGGDTILEKATLRVWGLNGDERIQRDIEDEEKRAFNLANAKIYARKEGREEGRAEGRSIGLEEGRAEGRAIGLEEGRAEGKNELIRKMFASGMDIEAIAKIANLTVDEVVNIVQ